MWAQSKTLEIEDFDRWREINNAQLSPDGQYVHYVLQPGDGDPTLMVYDVRKNRETSFARADGAKFGADSRHLVFRLHPAQDSVRALRRKKVEKENLPGDTLAILDLASGKVQKIANLRVFDLPEKWSGWLAYGYEPSQPDSSKQQKKKTKDRPYRLVIRSLTSGDSFVLDGVKQQVFAEEGAAWLAYSAGRDSSLAPGVHYWTPERAQWHNLLLGKGEYRQLALSRDGSRAAFLADRDTTKARIRPYILYAWAGDWDSTRLITAPTAQWLPAGWRPSEHGTLKFSYGGDQLFFGVAPEPILADTTKLEEEIAQVEVWTTNDQRMYTQEIVLADERRKQTYAARLDWASGEIRLLADTNLATLVMPERNSGPYALLYTEEPYLPSISWEGDPAGKDLYRLHLASGERKLIARNVRGEPEWSPDERFIYWYSYPDTAWMTYSVADEAIYRVTNNQPTAFFDEENDVPTEPGPYGLAGWLADDQAMIIYDRYDWWRIDPRGKQAPKRLTNARAQQRRLRYVQLDPEKRFFDPDDKVLVHFFEEPSRREGYAWLQLADGQLNLLQSGDFHYGQNVKKARRADRYLFTRENYQLFPDLQYSKDMVTSQQISRANPQQSQYQWGTIELYEWTSLDGQRLQGLLVKPAGFDPKKKYPLMVNFYERSSEGLHQHRAPEAHRSTINYTFYASRGYLIFNPDIPYRVGYPGESAYNAVMSGVTALVDEGYVDRERIGVQGHSWGGYQVAYLLTKTDIFRCAESGAPVVNMISAYGGIRWGTGLSRQFQYERTQSRIGATLWDSPLRYIENSPIFFVDKINTPVLILHNDQDGAVPWYQGIEWFSAMRRLGKPAWMLNYNGEPHWPLKRQNRMDFQRRMSQYFDYYLMDRPMPLWMERGVPPLEKGIRQGYEAVGSGE